MEYEDSGRYIPIIYLLYSWGFLSRVPRRVSSCRPLVNKPPPFKGLSIRIPITIPIKGLGLGVLGLGLRGFRVFTGLGV